MKSAAADGCATGRSARFVWGNVRRRFFVRAEMARQGADRRVFEQLNNGNVPLKNILKPALHLDQQQRMSAEIEEVVVNPDLLQSEQLLPDPRDRPLHLCARLDKINS